MEIREVQSKLSKMELEISKLLIKFSRETGCFVNDIALNTISTANFGQEKDNPIYTVDVEVSI